MAIEFNLSSIPSGAAIQNAELKLYGHKLVTGLVNSPKTIHSISSTWEGKTVTWRTAPPHMLEPIDTCNSNAIGEWEPFNLTSFVKEVVEHDSVNYGCMILMAYVNSGVTYYSSEATVTEKRPELTISYKSGAQSIVVLRNRISRNRNGIVFTLHGQKSGLFHAGTIYNKQELNSLYSGMYIVQFDIPEERGRKYSIIGKQ